MEAGVIKLYNLSRWHVLVQEDETLTVLTLPAYKSFIEPFNLLDQARKENHEVHQLAVDRKPLQ